MFKTRPPSHLNVLQPVGGLQAGQPMGLLDVGVDDIFELLQGLPHHVDVVDVQEDELCVLVLIAFVAASCSLPARDGVETHFRVAWGGETQ